MRAQMASDQVSQKMTMPSLATQPNQKVKWVQNLVQFTEVLPQPFLRNMVIFRNVVNGQPQSNWWDNQSNQVAFGRGNRGFIVINNDDW